MIPQFLIKKLVGCHHFIEMGKIVGRRDAGEKSKSYVLDVLRLRCLLGLQVGCWLGKWINEAGTL